LGTIFSARALSYQGEHALAAKQIEDMLLTYRSIGCGMLVPYFLTLLSEVECARGEYDKALDHLKSARETIVANSEAGMAAEVDRLEGKYSPAAISC